MASIEASKEGPLDKVSSSDGFENTTGMKQHVTSDEVSIRPGTSKRAVTTCVTAMMGGFLYGFSANAIAGTLSQTSFIAKFLSTSAAASISDGLLSGFLGGALVGAILQAPLSNRFGRKPASRVAAVIAIVAGALQAGSVNVGMICFSRVLCGIAAGMSISNSPVYMSEVAPPHVRGLLVGLQGVGIVGAYIACSIVALVFSYVETDYQWRLTFVVLTFVALLYLGSLFLIPESPRWLMEKGRDDEAIKVLEYLHKHDSDPNGTFAHAEAKQIKAQVEAERGLPHGYIYIFTTPALRKRAFCSILIWVMGQGTGITAIANLIPTFMGGLGFGTTMQLGLGVAWCSCLIFGCLVNIVLMDRLGRVKLLVIGGWVNAAIIAMLGALVKFFLNSTSTAGINAVVAFYFIFGFAFTSTIECTAYVYGSEIWPTHLRSEGSTIAYVSFMGNAIAYSAPVVQALDNIGWKYMMVFVAVTAASTIVITFYFPETKNLTLEEINLKFGDKVALDFKDALAEEERSPKEQHA